MTPEKTEEILDQYYAALKAGDRDALRNLLSPDMQVDYYGPDGLMPWGGHWSGIDAYFDFLDQVGGNLTIDVVEPQQSIVTDGVAVIVLNGTWTVRQTGRQVSATVANIFTFADGRIARYQVFNDTAGFGVGLGKLQAVD